MEKLGAQIRERLEQQQQPDPTEEMERLTALDPSQNEFWQTLDQRMERRDQKLLKMATDSFRQEFQNSDLSKERRVQAGVASARARASGISDSAWKSAADDVESGLASQNRHWRDMDPEQVGFLITQVAQMKQALEQAQAQGPNGIEGNRTASIQGQETGASNERATLSDVLKPGEQPTRSQIMKYAGNKTEAEWDQDFKEAFGVDPGGA